MLVPVGRVPPGVGNEGAEVATTITLPLAGVAFQLDPAQVAAQQPVTITAVPLGGTTVEYQFELGDETGWTLLRPYAATPTCPWTPARAGEVTLRVSAREQGTDTAVHLERKIRVAAPAPQ